MKNSKWNKRCSTLLLLIFCFGEIARIPMIAGVPYNGGPGSPEIQSFQPADNTELVDPFSGDFSYNIPLLDVGGYPINISYNANVGPEEEASWVGLGWNLNVGAINRNVRGLPDDFKGDEITKTQHVAPNYTIGNSMTFSGEVAGAEFLKGALALSGSQTIGFQYNNYNGWDYTVGSSNGIKGTLSVNDHKLSGSLGLSSGYSRSSGNYIRPSFGIGASIKSGETKNVFGGKVGMSMSSRKGLEAIKFKLSYAKKWATSKAKSFKNKKNVPYNSAKIGGTFPLYKAKSSYVPSFGMPMVNYSGTFGLKIGGEMTFVALAGENSGYFSLQMLKENQQQRAAFGYLYAHEGANNENALMDMNREKDGPYQDKMPHLPIPSFTNDQYFVAGQGFQGQFRPFRSDIGILSDPKVGNDGFGITAGADASFGNLVKAGGDFAALINNGYSGKWKVGNAAATIFKFFGVDSDDPLYEPAYFKQVGEMTAMTNKNVFNELGGFRPFNVKLSDHNATNEIEVLNESTARDLSSSTLKRQNREHRVNLLSYLNVEEAKQAGVNKFLFKDSGIGLVDDILGRYDIVNTAFSRDEDFRKSHHISEMTMTRDNGNRYVYGLPAYQISKKEVSFNAAGLTPTNGMVTYTPGEDNSPNNTRGVDNFFTQIETPPYAYAYHLTSILSPDYVDLNGNGPTSDDLGSYTRFHYTKPHDKIGWRMPFQQNQATFSDGYSSTDEDDKAHYIHGEKEIYYVKLIETKNFIAEFYTTERTDGFDVIDENGGAGTQHLHRLDSIKLFSRADVVKNGTSEAIPIKTVYFTYNYSLCDGFPSATTGKLTLRQIYFTYGKSNLKVLSRYNFTHGSNPNYFASSSDRWGTFKTTGSLPNEDFPYTSKDPTIANDDAGAWLLTRIETPTNGQVDISYEADTYAFVQDKKAMDMIPVLGFSETEASSIEAINNALYNDNASHTVNKFLYFQMNNSANSDSEVLKYLEGIEELYFRVKVAINKSGDDPNDEKITGFVPIDISDAANFGVTSFDNTIGWIQIPAFSTDGKDVPVPTGVHPFTKAASQQLAKELPKVAYGLDNTGPDDILEFFEKVLLNLGGFLTNVLSFNKFITEFVNEDRGRFVDLSDCFVRLNNPDGNKFGGGSRVKRIEVRDNWDEIGGVANTNFTYGQEYTYTRQEIINDETVTVSSGVASYEPTIGGEENPFTEPARYHIDKKLATDVNDFAILPINESYFPAANVGYSRIEVKNLKPAAVDRTGTGTTVQEFYTARDFPTIVQLTPLKQQLTKPIFNPIVHRNFATTSQGYSIELNDMHGKLKNQFVYAETDLVNPISGVRHSYHTDATNRKRLNNTFPTLDPITGDISDEIIGVDYEVVVDARESWNSGTEAGAQVNVDVALTGPIPVVTASGFPQISRTEVRYRSMVTNKVIMRSGILDQVEVFDKGSALATKNYLYDGQTGMLLVSGIENEFGDEKYSTTLPAYWMYEEMGMAYENHGLSFDTVFIDAGNVNITNAGNYFNQGDELALFPINDFEPVPTPPSSPPITPPIMRPSPATRGWVMEVLPNTVRIIDEAGQSITDSVAIQVTRSGKRNLSSVMSGSVLSNADPIDMTGANTFNFSKVVDANAQLFSRHWQSYLGFHIDVPQSSCYCVDSSDIQGYPLRFLAKDFITNALLQSLSSTGAQQIGNGIGLLPSTFNESSTVYHYTNYGSLAEFIITDTITNNTCTINLETEDGSPIPEIVTPNSLTPEYLSFESYTCDGTNKIRMILDEVEQFPRSVPVIVTSDCTNFLSCYESIGGEFPPVTCGIEAGDIANPFTTGIYGNWRGISNYKFITDRGDSGQLKNQGFLNEFHNFFNGASGNGPSPINGVTMIPASSPNGFWQQAVESQIIDPYGKELESVNALGIPSASVYGYGFQLPIAVAQRAHHQDIAFDSFEDYDFENQAESPFDACALPAHWRLADGVAPVTNDLSADISRDLETVHSGEFSLRLDGPVSIERDFFSLCDPTGRTAPSGNTYTIQDCDLIRNFTPTPGKYLISAWVKEVAAAPELDTTYERSFIDVDIQVGTTTTTETFGASGQLVDGWQQINGIFTVPDDPLLFKITIELRNQIGDGWLTYFDDIRIQPYNAVMNTYVYDPISLKLMATLDERNYGTFYEYDDEGNLARTEKETEKGRLTIQEIRSSKPYASKTPD